MKPRHRFLAFLGLVLGSGLLRGEPGAEIHAPDASRFPSDYQGKPFDDLAYRAEQQAEAEIPRQPYHAFTPALIAWDSKTPNGSGWVGKEEPSASIRLDNPDSEGKRVIHYHVTLNNYRYAVFGWQWGRSEDLPIDLQSYDAVSFSLKVTGPQKPQELFFGVTEMQPAPISLREYDPDFSDGSWHHITIPVRAMKWTGPMIAQCEVRGFVFKTFVWDPSDYDIQLDQFSFDRAVTPPVSSLVLKKAAPTVSTAKGQVIPGKIECAFYDLGGEGIAYHDTTPINTLSGVLNQQKRHQRAHATSYHWNFRKDEGVDISFTKDWADLNHTNLVDPPVNQLYIGGTEDGEWCNYTVNVKKAGAYKIIALYGNVADAKPISFSINGQSACECRFPVVTGSMHKWNQAEVGTISFPKAGVQLLTLHYARGYNLAYFVFDPALHRRLPTAKTSAH